mgnify:CR=1 FL=1
MLSDSIIKSLEEIVGKDNVFTSKADRICYSYDATQQSFLPDVVVHPGSTDEISRLMQLANREIIPVFPRGAGSGFTGGSLPTRGGIVLCTERMDRILEIDDENLVATVEPGVVTEQFQKEVEKRGLFYPPDPASLNFSTLGGNVAECAGGPRCIKYGVTKDFIIGLAISTSDASPPRLRAAWIALRNRASSSDSISSINSGMPSFPRVTIACRVAAITVGLGTSALRTASYNTNASSRCSWPRPCCGSSSRLASCSCSTGG